MDNNSIISNPISHPDVEIEKNIHDAEVADRKQVDTLPNSQTLIVCNDGILLFKENLRLAGCLSYIPFGMGLYEKRDFASVCRPCKIKHKCINERKLRIAALHENETLVKRLLDIGVNPNCADSKGRTSLHLVATKGNVEIVKLLLEKKADPNLVDCLGNTPLHLAACTNHINVVTLLLRAGTDVSIVDRYGSCPLKLAASKLKLLKNDSSSSALHIKQQVLQIIDMMKAYVEGPSRVSNQLLDQFQQCLSVKSNKEEIDSEVNSLLTALASIQLQSSDANSVC